QKSMVELEDKIYTTEKYLAGLMPGESELASIGVSPDELEALEKQYNPVKQPIPEGLVLMTFDDATVDHYSLAAPILEKYGGRGNFFVCEMAERLGGGDGFADKSFFMTWEQIKELYDRGHEIVNHSLTHSRDFIKFDAAGKSAEIKGIEDRCRDFGISKPKVFGYPGGACNHEMISLLHSLGYHWARGDQKDIAPLRVGQSFYDPLLDCPLALPSFNGAPSFDKRMLKRCVDLASGGRVSILAYHGIDNIDFTFMSFEEQVAYIYELGGRCITFTELEKYIDPIKAYDYWEL
ncbi:MAG: polysaccharide deacetylase family protein, partial [Oscillospiraceae bacterium]